MRAEVPGPLTAILDRLDAMIDAPGDPLKTPPGTDIDPIYEGSMHKFGELLAEAWPLLEAAPRQPHLDRFAELQDFYRGQLELRMRRIKPRLDELAERRAAVTAMRDQAEKLEREIETREIEEWRRDDTFGEDGDG